MPRPSRITLALCTALLLLLCWLTSRNLLNFLNEEDSDSVTLCRKNITLKYPVIEENTDNLVWMVQISDLHLSAFHDSSRITELEEFCGPTLDVIRPSVVLATGDLTEAVGPDGESSTQYEQEWLSYKRILYEANVPRKVLWLDIRGNHDNFDVLNVDSSNNYFREYSVQGARHPRSYFHVHETKNGERIGFLGVDACLEVGARRPFNFFGQLTSGEFDLINSYAHKSRNLNVSSMFWFGHYPTSTLRYPDSKMLRRIIADDERSVAYFCGHLHRVGGLVHQMYAWQKEGYFELLLADWKRSRIIRIMALDHGQFAFVDVEHGTWPIVLVTHPKGVMLVPPGGKLSVPFSKHIRILVFNPGHIMSVHHRVDDDQKWTACDILDGSLYISAWDQEAYAEGVHTIEIEIIDETGTRTLHHHQFSLDGTRIKTKFLARLFLMSNLSMVFYFVFACTSFLCTSWLVISRYITQRITAAYDVVNPYTSQRHCWTMEEHIRRIGILVNFDRFYYPLLLYPIYLFTGPWAIAYSVSNKIGVVFPWGLIINGTFTTLWITYFFGCVQIFFHTTLILYLAVCLNQRYLNIIHHQKLETSLARSLLANKFYVFVLLIQIWDTYNFWLSDGYLTLVFCPLKSWWTVMAIWLRYQVHILSKETVLQIHRIQYDARGRTNWLRKLVVNTHTY